MTANIKLAAVLLSGVALVASACGGSKPAPPAAQTAAAEASTSAELLQKAAQEAPLPPSELETQLPEGVRDLFLKPFTGDLDEMIKRRLVRIGVTFNRAFYFLDKGVQRGASYEYGRLIEERLNKRFKTNDKNKIYVFFVPLPRDRLLPALVDGRVDLVAAQLTVTPERQKLVDFCNPTKTNVTEILVTGRAAPPVASVQDLPGKEVFVRKTSSYYQSLLALNERFRAEGKPPVAIRDAPENLEDDDLLEMVNAGLLPAIVVDDYLATFWGKVFPDVLVHRDIALRTGGALAVAIRKNSPQLSQAFNTFMANYGLGTAFGKMIERRYLVSTGYVKNAAADAERQKFLALVELFKKYGTKYDVDFLLMAAQGYQESALNQNAKSRVGAVGVMQVMPETGKELRVGDISKLEPNIHAGVKYMRTVEDTFFKDEPMDELNKGLFTFASYNAGPGRVRQLRREAEKRGLNPNVWFGNVEMVAAERIGRETVTYVSNIYKYYIAYRLIAEERDRREASKAALKAKEAK
ncbi:MAG: transglycosylase SLT domain-containing protein [Bacteroidales bacterium]